MLELRHQHGKRNNELAKNSSPSSDAGDGSGAFCSCLAHDVFNMPAGQTSLQFVSVGDVGNAADYTGFGAVDYSYKIGKFDVTTAQYVQFLNAVAATDPFALYDPSMSTGFRVPCGITKTGTSGSFVYSALPSHENFPVNFVSWGDAARFCNWLQNGQPNGTEGPATTETGTYNLNGAVSTSGLLAVQRNPNATYVIPTENEWYKAAYYKGGSTNAGYWIYPTQNDMPPSNVLSATGTNNANFTDPNGGMPSDPINYLTPVGAFASSPGPYGTFDQGGNVYQWNETVIPIVNEFGRGTRGSFYNNSLFTMTSGFRDANDPSGGNDGIGFRIAAVPEPTAFMLVAMGVLSLVIPATFRSGERRNFQPRIS